MGKSIKRFFYLVIAMSLPLFAENAEFSFIGLGSGTYKVNFDDNVSQKSKRNSVFSLQLGKQTRKMRTVFDFDYGNDLLTAGIAIDYIPFDTIFGSPLVRPYIGVHSRYLRYNENKIDEDGFSLGGQAGLVIYATDTVDVDIAYQYSFIQNSDSLDTIDGFSISLHYFFE